MLDHCIDCLCRGNSCAAGWSRYEPTNDGRERARHSIIISTSSDGRAWSQPQTVTVNGNAVSTIKAPNIFSDGTQYHLLWLDPNGDVRHAQSIDGSGWQLQALPTRNIGSVDFLSFSQGPSEFNALRGPQYQTEQRDLVAQNLEQGGVAPTLTQSSEAGSISYGNSKFVVAAATFTADRSLSGLDVFESSNGTTWTQSTNVSPPNSGLKMVHIGYGGGHFIIGMKNEIWDPNETDLPSTLTCTYFDSPDGHSWSQMGTVDAFECGGNAYGVPLPIYWHGHTLLFNSEINARVFESIDFGAEWDIGFAINGAISLTEGPSPSVVSPPPPPICPEHCVAVRNVPGENNCVCQATCSSLRAHLPSVDCGQSTCPPIGEQICRRVPQVPITPCANTNNLIVSYTAPSTHCSDITLNFFNFRAKREPGAGYSDHRRASRSACRRDCSISAGFYLRRFQAAFTQCSGQGCTRWM